MEGGPVWMGLFLIFAGMSLKDMFLGKFPQQRISMEFFVVEVFFCFHIYPFFFSLFQISRLGRRLIFVSVFSNAGIHLQIEYLDNLYRTDSLLKLLLSHLG
jgi:hypothetical protein